MNIEFKGFEQFFSSFMIMGKSMLGVFLVIGIIILVITAPSKFTVPKKQTLPNDFCK